MTRENVRIMTGVENISTTFALFSGRIWSIFINVCMLQLEDKRAAMERQLISTKVQHQSLQKQHAFTKQQLQQMKVPCVGSGRVVLRRVGCDDECVGDSDPDLVPSCWLQVHIATLMQLQGARADPVQLERLQTMLCEKNTEIQNLLTKVRQMEKEEVRTVKASRGSRTSSEAIDERVYFHQRNKG